MKRKLFCLLTLLLTVCSGAWAADAVSATQTFKTVTVNRDSCVWSSFNVSVAKNNTAGGDGVYFTAPSDKNLSASGSSTVQFGKCAWVGYFQVPSATSSGYITMISSSDAADRPLYLNSYNETTNPTAKLVCAKKGSRVAFTSADVVNVFGGYYIKLSNTNSKDVKFNTIGILLNNESYPETVAVDPEFSLTNSTISTIATSQIIVGSKSGLDGITLSDISYGTPGIVTVDAETGVVTPVAAGTTTITFNSEAVAGKYNASTSNELSITVTQAITVFDGAGVTNQDIFLTLDNVNDKDYITTNSADKFIDKAWAGYEGKYLDMKTGRTISIKVKNVTAFEFYLSGTKGRKFTVKIGSADAVEYTQSSSSGFVSSGVISTGTSDEVTITIEGGESTLYPVYFKVNPATTVTTNAGKWASFTPEWNCTLEDGAKAYIITGVNGSTLTGEEVAVLEGGKGYFIKGEVASHPYTATATDADATSTDRNLVVGCATSTEINGSGNTKYILGTNDSGAGLFYVDSSITIPAGKAYLDAGKVIDTPARALSLDFDEGETTSLREIRNEELGIKNAEFFNLNGQRVAQPTKGLYIVNGRKVVIK